MFGSVPIVRQCLFSCTKSKLIELCLRLLMILLLMLCYFVNLENPFSFYLAAVDGHLVASFQPAPSCTVLHHLNSKAVI